MKNQMMIYIMIVAAVAAGAGFFGGTKYRDSQIQGNRNQLGGQFQGMMGERFNRQNITNGIRNINGRNGFRPVSGEILKIDNNSLTVKLNDNSSKIVILNDKTEYNKIQSGSKSDLKAGDKIGVFGTENQDGSVTAQNVQINPQFRARPTNLPEN